MRIAIDARELSGRPTGVGRYVSELLRAWDALPGARGHEFALCATSPVTPPPLPHLRVSQHVSTGGGPWWEQRALPRLAAAAGADVLFAPAYSGPLFPGMPMVVTIHDVSFAAHPEWFAPREGLRRRLTTRAAAWRARRVLTVSDFSKREIARCFGTDPSKIDVVYSGATQWPAAAPGAPADGPMVLYVGSVFTRRHVPELIAAFGALAVLHPSATLEIVGDNRSRPLIDLDALARDTGHQTRIGIRAYVSDSDLAALYARASVFVFLSEYEGFGLTPLDALAAGVPIVVLDTEVAREIYGPAAVYVTSPEPALVEAALDAALFDAGTRRRVLEAAPQVLERYSWQESARRTLQVLLAAAGG
ncbi:MAG TPA: glycosyltransferase family 1 protein [Vicinamibacterales bacterium]|nr:glycosyltransferase family 1 protein [Vicinamibacterales bacterium]